MPQTVLHSIKDFDLRDQRVFIRTDFNVPVKEGQVKDHIRLQACIPTIRYALENHAYVIVGSHRGRPLGVQKELSLEPFGYYLGEVLDCEVLFIHEQNLEIPPILLSSLNAKKMILLENLRFYPEEVAGSANWIRKLAGSLDIYINDAFSVSHRKHASIKALPEMVQKKGQGFSMQKEREILDYMKREAVSPWALVIGGSKVRDKIEATKQMIDRLDFLVVGGVVAYTFLKAKGFHVGSAFVQEDSLFSVKEIINRMEERNKALFLPVDHVVTSQGNNGKKKKEYVVGQNIPNDFCPVDIGPKTLGMFSRALKKANTIFWTGPMGNFEKSDFAEGTMKLCQILAEHKKAFRVIGGGDSIAAVLKSGQADQFNYISTGGGASLKYLSEGKLPGVESLKMEKMLREQII